MFNFSSYSNGRLSLPNRPKRIFINGLRLFITVLFFSSTIYSVTAQVIFEDDFESGSFGSEWTPLPNIDGEDGIVEVNPDGTYSIEDASVSDNSFFGAFIGKSDDSGTSTVNGLNLTLNLSSYDDLWLSFWIKDYQDEGQFADGLYFAESATGEFVKILTFDTQNWVNDWGRYPPISINKFAEMNGLELTSEFVIQFRQMGEKDFNSGSGNSEDGIILDEVLVWNQPMDYGSLPYYEDFETNILYSDENPLQFNSHIWWGWPDGTIGDNGQNVINPMNHYIIGGSEVAFESTKGLALSKRYDSDAQSIAAADIHLNFNGETQAVMEFKINDRYTDINSQNGIYLSVDGGETWSNDPVYYLDTESLINNWQQISFDLASAASEQGMTLSSNTIVRIQEIGFNNVSGSTGGQDGFYIDNISIFTSYFVEEFVLVCGGDYELPDGSVVNLPGEYESTLMSSNGLDSVIVTTLTFYPDESYSETVNLCEDESFTLPDDTEVFQEGTYTSFLIDDVGCEYTAETTIEILDSADVIITEIDGTLNSNYDGSASYQWVDCGIDEDIIGENLESFTPTVSGSYQLEVFDGSCITYSECYEYLVIIDFVEELNPGDLINIFPNPASESFNINGDIRINEIEIFNSLGERVNVYEYQEQYSTKELSTGIYQILITYNSGKLVSKKLVVR